jgi:hypothetical protein
MANSNNSIEYIETTSGLVKVYYPALDALPVSDATLREKGMFADAKAVGDRLKPVEDKLAQNNKDILNIKEVNNTQDKSIDDINQIISINGLGKEECITQVLRETCDDVSEINLKIGKQYRNTVTDWNKINNTGWYKNDDSTKVSNAPVKLSGYSTFGEHRSIQGDRDDVNLYQRVYLTNENSYRSFERFCLKSNLNFKWTDWVETTPMSSAITITEFSKLIQ